MTPACDKQRCFLVVRDDRQLVKERRQCICFLKYHFKNITPMHIRLFFKVSKHIKQIHLLLWHFINTCMNV